MRVGVFFLSKGRRGYYVYPPSTGQGRASITPDPPSSSTTYHLPSTKRSYMHKPQPYYILPTQHEALLHQRALRPPDLAQPLDEGGAARGVVGVDHRDLFIY